MAPKRRSPAGSSESMVTAGLSVLNPKLTDTGIAATNNRNFVGIPDYKSNILAEYRVPVFTAHYFTFDWQHVGRRADRRHQQRVHTAVQHFRSRRPVHRQTLRKVTTWRITANNAS